MILEEGLVTLDQFILYIEEHIIQIFLIEYSYKLQGVLFKISTLKKHYFEYDKFNSKYFII